MLVSYMIASRNRRAELLKTLQSCRAQDYPWKEVHVVDDGSTDGTSEAVRQAFPDTILTRNEVAIGSVASRNQIFARVLGDVLIGFDDDSRFIEEGATKMVVERFCREPDLGLLEFQDIGPEHPERVSGSRQAGEWHTVAFGAGRFALRRAVLRLTGLYPGFFLHAYEEPDLAIRIWDVGYRCLRWNDVIVWHEFSEVNRDERRTHFLHARNELLSIGMRAPWQYLVPVTAWRALSQLRYSLKRGWWTVEPRAWWAALKMTPLARADRRPVKRETYRRCLRLGRERISDPRAAWAAGR